MVLHSLGHTLSYLRITALLSAWPRVKSQSCSKGICCREMADGQYPWEPAVTFLSGLTSTTKKTGDGRDWYDCPHSSETFLRFYNPLIYFLERKFQHSQETLGIFQNSSYSDDLGEVLAALFLQWNDSNNHLTFLEHEICAKSWAKNSYGLLYLTFPMTLWAGNSHFTDEIMKAWLG